MNITVKKSNFSLFLALLLALPWVALAAPGNVKGVDAVAESSSTIKISWNAVDGASEYRIYYNDDSDGGSVEDGESFEYVNQVETKSSSNNFTLTNLKADTNYYMSVIALNAQGEESDSYSLEVQAKTLSAGSSSNVASTPSSSSSNNNTKDTLAPIVLKVVAEDNTHVLVGFSEKVVLPASKAETAFNLHEQINASNVLAVKSASVYATDTSGKTIVLETAPQKKNMNYVLTVGIQVKDVAGNAINSGSSDSGFFIGTDKVAETNTNTSSTSSSSSTTDTKVVACGTHYANDPSANTTGAKECFDVSFETCSPSTYTKVSKEDGKESIYSYKVMRKEGTGCKVESQYTKNESQPTWANKTMTCTYDTTKDFTNAENEVLNSFSQTNKLGDCSGPLFTLMSSGIQNSNSESNTNPAADDKTAPEEVTDLRLSFEQMANSALYMVGMSWVASKNTAGDLFDQILYQSTDLGKTYDGGKSLGKSDTDYELENLEGGKEYTFKVTTKDEAGNESTGAVKSIRLPSTGMGMGMFLVGSGLAAQRLLRRKRK